MVALLTDFGTRDSYVAAMKGVIAARTTASIIDLSHEITPFDVFEAARFLRTAVRYLPSADDFCLCIVVAVVDPGVGSQRRIIALEQDGRVLLAPDNGLLSFVARSESAGTSVSRSGGLNPAATLRSGPRVVEVTNESLFLPAGSSTFHGRDRFAPVAAALANGRDLAELGAPVAVDSLVRLPYEPPVYEPSRVRGSIVALDRFGNLITDVEAAQLAGGTEASPLAGWVLRAGWIEVKRSAGTYADSEGDREPFMLVGSSGCVEIAVTRASAAEVLQLGRFAPIELTRRS